MRIQIIPSENQPLLRDYYGCHLWKIYRVLWVLNRKSYKHRKLKKEWKEYFIEVKCTSDTNSKGQKTRIRLFENECKVIEN